MCGPTRSYPGIGCLYDDVDLVIVRENNEGFQPDRNVVAGSGEFRPTQDVTISVRVITREGSRKVAEAALQIARTRRKRLTIVHKDTVFKLGCGMFVEECRRAAEGFPDVAVDEVIVDTMAMRLIRDPQSFDTVVTTNMFGDILTDEAAGLVGGLGMAPGLCIGRGNIAMAQATHGSAPDIAGKRHREPLRHDRIDPHADRLARRAPRHPGGGGGLQADAARHRGGARRPEDAHARHSRHRRSGRYGTRHPAGNRGLAPCVTGGEGTGNHDGAGARGAEHLTILQTASLTTVLEREIESLILSGELPPGDRINEIQLARRFGTSRGPIREATRSLEGKGLVEVVRNRGVFIRRLSLEEALEIYDLRSALFGLAGRLLAARMNDEILDELSEALRQMEVAAARARFRVLLPAEPRLPQFHRREGGQRHARGRIPRDGQEAAPLPRPQPRAGRRAGGVEPRAHRDRRRAGRRRRRARAWRVLAPCRAREAPPPDRR